MTARTSTRRLLLRGLLLVTLATLATGAEAGKRDVLNSSHNLSAGGPGPVTSSEAQVCIFCHAPHNVDPNLKPLWNHQLSTRTYTLYGSSTYDQSSQQPQTPSKQCLSCHDGTVALGQTLANGLIPTSGSMSSSAILSTSLADDHPISFATPMTNDGQLNPLLFGTPPSTADPAVQLRQGLVECTTCHDVHQQNIDTVATSYLVRSNSSSAICLACHDPSRPRPNRLNGWSGGAHGTATNTTPGTAGFGSYSTVALNACLNCHLPHNVPAASAARLVRGYEEAACSSCHSGTAVSPTVSPALRNVLGEFAKTYSHPTTTVSGKHDAAENAYPLNGATNRHSECVDCHNPHPASNTGGSTTPPGVESALLGVWGVNSSGGPVTPQPVSYEYEVCLKCHGDSTGKPQSASYSVYGRTPYRQTFSAVADPYNLRLDFQSSVSRHNVINPRTGASVPSLRANMLNLDGSASTRSMAAGTYIYCTDCHNNNQDRKFAGTGPNGPHGSSWTHLLERRYEVDPLPASPGGDTPGVTYVAGVNGTYALCYKCHDIGSGNSTDILQDNTFGKHNRHVIGADTSCSTCHAPHGIQGGNTTNNLRLVNFDTNIVGPDRNGDLFFRSLGANRGECYLTCHGKNHTGLGY